MTDSDTITVHLTLTAEQGAPRVPLAISKSLTPTAFRQQVSQETKIPLQSLKVIFRGRLIADDNEKKAVVEFKLEDGSVLHCMGKPVKAESATTAPAGAGTPTAAPPLAAPAGSTMSLSNAASVAPPVPAAPVDPLTAALNRLRSSNSAADYQTALQTLQKLLANIESHPTEEKYRKVKKENPAFQRRLGGLSGGQDALLAAGFVLETVDGVESYILHPTAENWPKLVAAKAAVAVALASAAAAAAPLFSAANPMGAGMPGMGATNPMGAGMPGMGGMPPMPGGMGGMADMMANMPPAQRQMLDQLMSNPQALSAMMQNPEVQRRIRADPNFGPMAEQSLQMLTSNPEMAAQVMQMARNNPGLMGGGGGMPPFGGAAAGGGMPPFGGAAPVAGGGGAAPAAGGAPAPNDQDLTEEEMIAEAIRRSLQEDGNGNN